jgi:hypothetical protein
LKKKTRRDGVNVEAVSSPRELDNPYAKLKKTMLSEIPPEKIE